VKRMTVLYAVTDPTTALAFLRGQLRYVAEQGFEVHLACGPSDELSQFAQQEGVTLHQVPLARKWLSRDDLTAVLRAMRTLRRVRPDVLNYSTPKAALVWAIASFIIRPRYTVFLLRGLRLEGEKHGSMRYWVLWVMEYVAARRAHVVVCVSQSLRRRAIDLRLASPEKSVVLCRGSSNGVDTRRFLPIGPEERSAARGFCGVGDGDFVIGYVGRLARDKGISDLLDAAEQLLERPVPVTCVLVGPAEPGFSISEELEKRAIVARAVICRPPAKHIELEYAAFDIFVLPSHREGLSNALLEAQARGLPCITTTGTGCADAISPGVTGFAVPPGDPKALAEAIVMLQQDPSLRQQMGWAGRARVEQYFRPRAVWDELIRLYERRPSPCRELNQKGAA
jgi:glycosyltransferase involved in cell wall biosynthesis